MEAPPPSGVTLKPLPNRDRRVVIGLDRFRFGSRPWHLLNLSEPVLSHLKWEVEICVGQLWGFKRECVLTNTRVACPTSCSLPVPGMHLHVSFLSRQSAWHQASFQNVSLAGMIFPLQLHFWFIICTTMRNMEDSYEPNTVTVAVLEVLWSNYFTIRYIDTNFDTLCGEKQCGVVWEGIPGWVSLD